MRLPRLSLLVPWVLLAMGCGGGSTGIPDLPDPGIGDVSDPGPGSDEAPADRPGGEVPGDDAVVPDDGTQPSDLGGTDVPGGETADETFEEVETPRQATCADPIPVWEGRTLGPDLPPVEELDYEVVASAAQGPGLSCAGTGTPQGEAVFRLVIGRSLLVGIAAEAVGGDVQVAVAFVPETCAGAQADCFTSPPEGNIAEDGAVLPPGVWLAVVRAVPLTGGAGAVGQPLEVSFWFDASEDCTDGVDNNDDGDADCDDPLCFFDDACTGGRSGEDCTDPFLVENGLPVAPGTVFNAHQTLAGRRDDVQPGPGCWARDRQAGDLVWRFVLDRDMTVEASMGFFDGTFGHVFLMDESCGRVEACIPPVFGEEPFVLATLGPGTWHAVADFGEATPQDLSFEFFLIFDEP